MNYRKIKSFFNFEIVVKKLIFSFVLILFSWSLSAQNSDKRMLLESERNTIQIFKNNVNSVVNVSSVKVARSFWDMAEVNIPAGAGSGFVWDKEGHIVTNFHVVQGNSFLITFHKDKKQYKAKIIGVAPHKDIAVLKLIDKVADLTPIKIGRSNTLEVGQKSVAIGNPFGFDHTITSGIISAIDRQIEGVTGVKIKKMIQTDASINPGNSGGPLLASSGDLIGMNTIIISGSGSSSGVGFAVPVDTIARIVPQLIKYGKVIRPGLGISLLRDEQRSMFGVNQGVVIRTIFRGSGADSANLRGIGRDRRGRYYLGDIIVKINNNDINSFDDIYNTLDDYKIGDVVDISYIRDGKTNTVKLKLTQLSD